MAGSPKKLCNYEVIVIALIQVFKTDSQLYLCLLKFPCFYKFFSAAQTSQRKLPLFAIAEVLGTIRVCDLNN